MAKRAGRGRLSGIELLPGECDGIIAWAAAELQNRARTQLDIYREFYTKLEELKHEHRGELEFDIPSFSSFNRHSIKLASFTRDMEETRTIAAAAAARFDPAASDDVTRMAVEAIKSVVFHVLTTHRDKIDPKSARELANAMKAALQAQDISDSLKSRIEKRFEKEVGEAVDTVVQQKGMTAETAEAIKSQILGVRSQ